MRQVLAILLLMGAILLAKMVYEKTVNFKQTHSNAQPTPADNGANLSGNNPLNLAGLPPEQESYLENAMAKGHAIFKKWLDYWGPRMQDPRKAWIELDYVLMVSRDDMAEAKRVFAEVRARLAKNSPVYARMKSIEKAYE
jgi:hypothetical protein